MKFALLILFLISFNASAERRDPEFFARVKKEAAKALEKSKAAGVRPPPSRMTDRNPPENVIADYYIGNGGEGIENENGELFLRDLYDDNVHRHPYFGKRTDPKIRLSSRLVNSLRVDAGLLARKLNDLNEMSPNLGYYILSTIQFYRWIFIEEAQMTPVPNDGSVLATYKSRVTIANRLKNNIRIYWPAFNRLSEEHKVALIIHETVSAMVRPLCVRQFECYQRSDVVRSIVAATFTAPIMRSTDSLTLWDNALSIPPVERRSQCVNLDFKIAGNLNGQPVNLEGAQDPARRAQFFKSLCQRAQDYEMPLVNLKITGPSMTVKPHAYFIFEEGRAPYENINVSIIDHHPRTRLIRVEHIDGSRWARGLGSCQEYLENMAIDAFTGNIGVATIYNCPTE